MDGLYKLWIIHREAGVSIFDQTFAELPTNISPDLIGGFLISILSFSQEVAKQNIDYLQLEHIRIVYHPTPKYIIAVACDNHINHAEIDRMLNQIEIRFNAKYQKIMDGTFSGNITIFQDFGAEVEEVFATKSIGLKFLEEKVDDIKGYYIEQFKKMQDSYRRFLGMPLIKADSMAVTHHENAPLLKFQIIETVTKPLKKISQITKEVSKKIKEKLDQS